MNTKKLSAYHGHLKNTNRPKIPSNNENKINNFLSSCFISLTSFGQILCSLLELGSGAACS